MRTAFPAGLGSLDPCKWNQLTCIRFRVPGKFRQADRLPSPQPWFHEGWMKRTTLYSFGLRSQPLGGGDHRTFSEKRRGGSSLAIATPEQGTAGASEIDPGQSPRYQHGNH